MYIIGSKYMYKFLNIACEYVYIFVDILRDYTGLWVQGKYAGL